MILREQYKLYEAKCRCAGCWSFVITWKNYALIFVVLCVVVATTFSEVNEPAVSSKRIERLQKDLLSAGTDEEKRYIKFCIEFEQIEDSGSEDDYRNLRERLLRFGREKPDNVYGAQAMVLAGDISFVKLKQLELARSYFSKAQMVFSRYPDSPLSKEYLPYIGIRIGDSYVHDGNDAAAVYVWTETFEAYHDYPFALCLPAKICTRHESYLPREKAREASIAFYDEAINEMGESEARIRLEIERIGFVCQVPASLIPNKQKVVDEITEVLGRYKPGECTFVDLSRSNLTSLKKYLQHVLDQEEAILQDIESDALDYIERSVVKEPSHVIGESNVCQLIAVRDSERKEVEEEVEHKQGSVTKVQFKYGLFICFIVVGIIMLGMLIRGKSSKKNM